MSLLLYSLTILPYIGEIYYYKEHNIREYMYAIIGAIFILFTNIYPPIGIILAILGLMITYIPIDKYKYEEKKKETVKTEDDIVLENLIEKLEKPKNEKGE